MAIIRIRTRFGGSVPDMDARQVIDDLFDFIREPGVRKRLRKLGRTTLTIEIEPWVNPEDPDDDIEVLVREDDRVGV